MSLYSSTGGDFKYASVSFMSAAYREGHITVAGKKRHVYLLDYNCNGRFNDEIAVQKNVQGAGGQLYFSHGDLLLIDPDPNDPRGPSAITASSRRPSSTCRSCFRSTGSITA